MKLILTMLTILVLGNCTASFRSPVYYLFLFEILDFESLHNNIYTSDFVFDRIN